MANMRMSIIVCGMVDILLYDLCRRTRKTRENIPRDHSAGVTQALLHERLSGAGTP
jgi:hypothetical protein